MDHLAHNRRDLLLAPLLAMAGSLAIPAAEAAGIDPAETIVKLPDQIAWREHYAYPRNVSEEAPLFGEIGKPGQYFVLVRWHPGFMSAPHYYDTDRLAFVLSGTWYVGNGLDFAPEKTVPVPAGSFLRRVAKTVHYDGVRSVGTEPVVIAITGLGPTRFHPAEPTKPNWRRA